MNFFLCRTNSLLSAAFSTFFFNVRSPLHFQESAMGTTLWDEQLICVSSVTRGFAVIKSSGASTKAGSRVLMRRQIVEMSEQHEGLTANTEGGRRDTTVQCASKA